MESIETIVENGYTESKNGCVYTYVPSEGSDDIIVYIPGAGGGGRKLSGYLDEYLTENPTNLIVYDSDPGADKRWITPVSDALDNLGKNGKLTIFTFSQSTFDGISAGAHEAAKVDENGESIYNGIVVQVNGTGSYFHSSINNLTEQDYANMKNADTKIIFEAHQNGSRELLYCAETLMNDSCVQKLISNGVSTYVVETPVSTQHSDTNKVALSQFMGVVMGTYDEDKADTIVETSDENVDLSTKSSDKFRIFVPTVGSDGSITWNLASKEQLGEIFPDVYMQEFAKRYSTLSSLSKYKKLDTSTVASDLYDVYTGMSDISKTISSSNCLFTTINQEFDSTTASIPKNLQTSVNSLYGISNELLSNLSNDIDSICSIAEYLYSMDQELCANTSTLSDEYNSILNSVYGSDNYKNFSNEISKLSLELDKIDTSCYQTTYEKGKAGKASTSEIMASVSPLIQSLNTEIEDANKAAASINNFASTLGSGNLLGNIWTKASECLNAYSDLMNVRKDAAQTLQEALKVSTAIVLNYIGEEGELDDSKLPELNEQYNRTVELISDLEATIATMKANPYSCTSYLKEDGTYGETCSGYKADEISSAQATLDSYITARDELKQDIEKLEGLAEVINKANEIMDQAIEAIKASYGSATGEIGQIKNVTFASDGIKYESIMGEGFDKSAYINLFDASYDKYQVQLAADESSALASTNGLANTASAVGSTGSGSYTGSSSGSSSGSGYSGESTGSTGGSSDFGSSNNDSSSTTEIKTEESDEEDKTVEEKQEDSKDNDESKEYEEPIKEETTKETKTEEKTNESKEEPHNNESKKEENDTKSSSVNNNSKKYYNENKNSGVETKKEIKTETTNSIDNNITSEPIVDTNNLVDENIPKSNNLDTYVEPVLTEPKEVVVDTNNTNIDTVTNTSSKNTKTLGIATGVGLAVGAAALGTHTLLKNKESDDEDEGY